MKKLMMLLLVLAMLLPASGLGEIYFIADETQLPEGWTEKDLMRLTALDTDRSDAMLLQCGGENMMIDGGSFSYYPRLEELFADKGITEFKYLFSTHSDNDHIQGLTQMVRSDKYVIGGFYSAVRQNFKADDGYHQAAVRSLKSHEVPYVQIYDGDVLTLGGATINVVRCDEPWGANARSAGTQIIFGNSKVLLLGDCDGRVQEYFVKNRDHSLLECDILKAVHHGINAFEETLLEVAQPEFIFVPNYKAHGSIKASTKNKFAEYNALYSGDGAVIMETDGTDWYIWQLPNWTKKD